MILLYVSDTKYSYFLCNILSLFSEVHVDRSLAVIHSSLALFLLALFLV